MEPVKSVKELRSQNRRRTLKIGRVYFFDDRHSYDCMIRDLTVKGARLSFGFPYHGPSNVLLQIGFGDLVIGRIPSEIRWRKGNEVGVMFLWPKGLID